MGVNQQQSTNTTATKDNIIQLLQSSIGQKSFNNKTTHFDIDRNDAADTRILKRSKRQESKGIIEITM